MGHEVLNIAKSADEAVSISLEMHPSLVLMDIGLRGGSNGIQAAAEIRSQMDIPVVFLTSHSDRDTLQRAKATDPCGYIVKPLTDASLPVGIEMALSKHHMQQNLQAMGVWLFSPLKAIQDGV